MTVANFHWQFACAPSKNLTHSMSCRKEFQKNERKLFWLFWVTSVEELWRCLKDLNWRGQWIIKGINVLFSRVLNFFISEAYVPCVSELERPVVEYRKEETVEQRNSTWLLRQYLLDDIIDETFKRAFSNYFWSRSHTPRAFGADMARKN